MPCPHLPATITPIADLIDTGFAPTTRLTVTETLHLSSATGPEQVCFNSSVPFRSQSSPTVAKAGTALLLDCSVAANKPPCVQSRTPGRARPDGEVRGPGRRPSLLHPVSSRTTALVLPLRDRASRKALLRAAPIERRSSADPLDGCFRETAEWIRAQHQYRRDHRRAHPKRPLHRSGASHRLGSSTPEHEHQRPDNRHVTLTLKWVCDAPRSQSAISSNSRWTAATVGHRPIGPEIAGDARVMRPGCHRRPRMSTCTSAV